MIRRKKKSKSKRPDRICCADQDYTAALTVTVAVDATDAMLMSAVFRQVNHYLPLSLYLQYSDLLSTSKSDVHVGMF